MMPPEPAERLIARLLSARAEVVRAKAALAAALSAYLAERDLPMARDARDAYYRAAERIASAEATYALARGTAYAAQARLDDPTIFA